MAEPAKAAPVWKRVLAAVLDFFSAFFAFGMVIASIAGGRTAGGFSLDGWPAVVLFALIAAYFFIGRRYLGGTLWDRILGIARPQPK